MSYYSGIRKIKILSDPDEVNKQLKNWWELLELYKCEDRIMFVLGNYSYNPHDEFRVDYTREGTV